MSLFSPVTNRSISVRLVYAIAYLLLAIGAVTMIGPLLILVSGSMSGPYEEEPITLYPKYLFSERALWIRYLEAKYAGSIDNFKMAWGDESLNFYSPTCPTTSIEDYEFRLWKDFRKEGGPLSTEQAGLAFARSGRRDASYENDQFRKWLLHRFENNFGLLNEVLLTAAPRATDILPPIQGRIILPEVASPLNREFDLYLAEVPENRRLIWNVGGFFRAVYLPRRFGVGVTGYNQACGTAYTSYEEVPFPATIPKNGGVPWFDFVQRVLNPAFVEFTDDGKAAWRESGLTKVEFLRTKALPQHIKIVSLDTQFSEWAAIRGFGNIRIPQKTIDWEMFRSEEGFWRWQFSIQNFNYVLQEIVIQGNGVRNTLILVVLSVFGALTVNPMAAYALSRFKIRQSYQILLFFLATTAFPAEVAMIPNFLQIKELGMINTFWALIIPGLVNGFSIFLLKGFFDSLPKELYEAADIDGANEWQIFWGITMNLSKPILSIMALGAFGSAYGAFLFALILVPDPSMWTLMVWIYQLQQEAGTGIIYASILLTAIPTLLVYACTQNYIMRGIIVPTDK